MNGSKIVSKLKMKCIFENFFQCVDKLATFIYDDMKKFLTLTSRRCPLLIGPLIFFLHQQIGLICGRDSPPKLLNAVFHNNDEGLLKLIEDQRTLETNHARAQTTKSHKKKSYAYRMEKCEQYGLPFTIKIPDP